MEVPDKDLLHLYRWLWMTRILETRTCDLYKQGTMPELQHASIGQEAIGVGACYGLRRDDYVEPSLRTRAAFLVKGIDPARVMGAMYGKVLGAGRGKSTSHHMGDTSVNMLAGTGIIGGSIAIGVGAALAAKLRKQDSVSVIFFGDGASNRGDFHECVNLAAVLDLPAIFVLENNQYAMSTPVTFSIRVKHLSDRACAYGIPGVTVDGQDVLAVHSAVQEAIARARAGNGPSLIECLTYRWHCHQERDTEDPRPAEELAHWKSRDPIRLLGDLIVAKGAADEAQLKEIEDKSRAEVEDAIKQANEAPYPAPEETLLNVYAPPIESQEAQPTPVPVPVQPGGGR